MPAIRKQIAEARENLLAAPMVPQANGRYGMLLHSYGDYEGAAKLYRRAAWLAPDHPDWQYYLARALQRLGRQSDAEAALRRVIRRQPDFLPARYALADSLLSSSQPAAANEHVRYASQRSPGSARAHLMHGRVMAALGDNEGAIARFQRAIQIHPAYGEAHFALSAAYRKSGSPLARVHARLHKIHQNSAPLEDDPKMDAIDAANLSVAGYARRASKLAAAGDAAGVGRELDRLLAFDPRNGPAHANLISVRAGLGEFQQAELHYREAMAINPRSAFAHFEFGKVAMDRGLAHRAVQAFQASLVIDPENPDGLRRLGAAFEKLGRMREAIREYRRASVLDPDNPAIAILLGRALAGAGQYAEAIPQLEIASRLEEPLYFEVRRFLGVVHARVGQRDRGIEIVRAARNLASERGNEAMTAHLSRSIEILQRGGFPE